ncbi:hypothetical protein CEXT_594461 [Caerostris extrusa]|uniref:Uncharacterized protein n=1 Tax=Caerostris extrusa TaxID=172846 RepID=A0AAV4UXF4_CAEEX|nr:hypothetical protein CEXT_594461 [Caerostris extrusa]
MIQKGSQEKPSIKESLGKPRIRQESIGKPRIQQQSLGKSRIQQESLGKPCDSARATNLKQVRLHCKKYDYMKKNMEAGIPVISHVQVHTKFNDLFG